MVKLLLGGKGAGKTKEMIAFANDKVEVKKVTSSLSIKMIDLTLI